MHEPVLYWYLTSDYEVTHTVMSYSDRVTRPPPPLYMFLLEVCVFIFNVKWTSGTELVFVCWGLHVFF